MEYEVKHLNELKVIGYLSKYATMQDAQQNLPKAWQNFMNQVKNKLYLN